MLIYDFKRKEKKYILSPSQYKQITEVLMPRLKPTPFSGETICSIYYDTPDSQLIRLSLQHPVFKEKFRIRWYGEKPEHGRVFPEIKKKFEGIVYKRRITCRTEDISCLLRDHNLLPSQNKQIQHEIHYLFKRYPLSPACLIAYERDAYECIDLPELRITFDHNVRAREDQLTPLGGSRGELILPEGYVVMEIKFPGFSPLWLARLLSENKIFSRSFSKYGTRYMTVCSRKKG